MPHGGGLTGADRHWSLLTRITATGRHAQRAPPRPDRMRGLLRPKERERHSRRRSETFFLPDLPDLPVNPNLPDLLSSLSLTVHES